MKSQQSRKSVLLSYSTVFLMGLLIFWDVSLAANGSQLSSSLFDKPGRCASVAVKCSRPNPSSRCFFHFECPGKQLCCSVDGCLNACMDPVNGSNSDQQDPLTGSISEKSLNISSNSTIASLTVQSDGFFSCKLSGLKIKTLYRCNGRIDCPGMDNSDELDCPCAADQILCSNGLCIDMMTLCKPTSGGALCPVQNLNCSDVACTSSSNFRCKNSQCVAADAKCDGTFNCLDGSDEEGCACNSGNLQCDGGLCKSLLNVWCNKIPDCQDRSDELTNCSCITGQFKCTNSRCIPQYHVCDFTDDCLDGSDELNCPVTCSSDNNLFRCANGQCVAKEEKCDSTHDCPGGPDEIDCKPAGDVSKERAFLKQCPRKGHFSCGPPQPDQCVPLSAWCDRIADCENQSDEPANCSTTCPVGAFQCDDNRCISGSNRCDGRADCVDKSDEVDCNCGLDQMPLPLTACLDQHLFCNSVRDAADGLDEEQCTCRDRIKRLSPEKLCDGMVDCPDSSDELSCGNCTVSQFYCIKSKQCVFRNQTCDGFVDCGSYGEDEENCLGVVPQPCQVRPDMQIRQERAGCLAVQNRGEWIPVCAERWSNSLSDAICEIMGYDKSIITNLIQMDLLEIPGRTSDQKIPRAIDGPQIVISAAKSCPSRKKVYIECGSLTCGQSPSDLFQSKILGSVDVPEGKYPWTVGLYKNGKYFCAATIIDPSWLLTAAHCVAGMESSYIVARLGALKRSSMTQNEQFVPVDSVVIHPNYKDSWNTQILTADSDLALLHMSVPAHWNTNIKPVCLPARTSNGLPPSVVITSWSQVKGNQSYPTNDVLQESTIAVMNSSVCKMNPYFEGSVTDNMFCANFSKPERGGCNVDNGGAALEKDYFGRWSVVGVTSSSLGCNTDLAVTGFTYIARYIDWIGSVTSGAQTPRMTFVKEGCAGGVRCELGTCISPSQVCDGTIDCPLASDELNCQRTTSESASVGSCAFLDGKLCGYRQDLSDQLNWYRGGVATRFEGIPIQRENSTSNYIYVSSRMREAAPGASGRLFSPKLASSDSVRCLQITFMTASGTFAVYDADDSNKRAKVISDFTGFNGWNMKKLEIPASMSSFVLEGRLENNYSSLIAVQKVELFNGLCGNSTDV